MTTPTVAFVAALLGAEPGEAAALLGDPAPTSIDAFVASPSPAAWAAARAAAAGSPPLTTVVGAAAFSSGLTTDVPDAAGLEGELAVLALTVQAAALLEAGREPQARAVLEQASALPGLDAAARARALASLADQLPAGDRSLAVLDEAIGLLGATGHEALRASLHLRRAVVAHELAEGRRHLLVEAVRSYQSALVLLREDREPEDFAFANANIALAILALPMTQASDQVRLGVAVQSLRAALRVYTPSTHPQEWSAAQLNLANALQYLPSRHQADNLAEAVELYEGLLAFRSPDRDPGGYARVLANQANALAHLGILDHADEKLAEAAGWFAVAGDTASLAAVEEQRERVAERRVPA